jgi:hypothetical protein
MSTAFGVCATPILNVERFAHRLRDSSSNTATGLFGRPPVWSRYPT